MIFGKGKAIKDEIINIGKKLYDLRLAASHSGNLSARVDENNILITTTGSSLGDLYSEDILKVDLTDPENFKNKRLTTEFPLHLAIYKNFKHQVTIHCHPALANAYFAAYSDLKTLTFESKLYLGNVPVVEQETPSITQPELVIEALKSNNLVVIKNHGVISVADKFSDALYLVETLEEAVKTVAVARLFRKEILDDLDKELKEILTQDKTHLMFSQEHIQAIVDLVNQDEFISQKGQELDLTLKLVIKLDGFDKNYKFTFEKGKIIKLESDLDAPFVISAPAEVWEMVFLGKIDPFVATMQGKMKLQGQIGQLSKWYVPFSRLFELFRQVKIK